MRDPKQTVSFKSQIFIIPDTWIEKSLNLEEMYRKWILISSTRLILKNQQTNNSESSQKKYPPWNKSKIFKTKIKSKLKLLIITPLKTNMVLSIIIHSKLKNIFLDKLSKTNILVNYHRLVHYHPIPNIALNQLINNWNMEPNCKEIQSLKRKEHLSNPPCLPAWETEDIRN